ncbi:unnamed protein product [Symbiodinium sp. CCMP2592]|nr:unnamed protein product [Symbiodinium sp. CCMP2592]
MASAPLLSSALEPGLAILPLGKDWTLPSMPLAVAAPSSNWGSWQGSERIRKSRGCSQRYWHLADPRLQLSISVKPHLITHLTAISPPAGAWAEVPAASDAADLAADSREPSRRAAARPQLQAPAQLPHSLWCQSPPAVEVSVLSVFHDVAIAKGSCMADASGGGRWFTTAQQAGYAAVLSDLCGSRVAGFALVMRVLSEKIFERRQALLSGLCGLSAALGLGHRARALSSASRGVARSEVVLCENGELSVDFPIWSGDGPDGTREATEELLKASGGSAAAGAESDWAGLWRVTYAPHLRTLGSLALTQLDVYYDIAPPKANASPRIRSFARFEGPFGRGWLNAAGTLTTLSSDEVEVNFSDFWIDFNSPLPRPEPEAGDRVGSDLARVFFLRDLSRFPVRSLNLQTGLTVFRFPPLGVSAAGAVLYSCAKMRYSNLAEESNSDEIDSQVEQSFSMTPLAVRLH